VPAATIREVANEYLDNACVGETIEFNGMTLPYRPVSVTLGKTVNNGWGGYECCWARTMLAVLVGALEVPGGTIGTTVRLNRPHENRLKSVTPGPDGFMYNALNPTDPEHWVPRPTGRNAHRPLVPLVLNTGWSQSLGPSHLAWMFQREGPKEWPQPSWPELWFVFRSNPTNSFWASRQLADTIARMPFTVCFAYTVDETNYMADILLPEASDLESLQLIRMGGTGFQEQFWIHQGFVLRQPAVAPRGEAKDFTWITTELARRTDLLGPYIAMVNRGAGAVIPLQRSRKSGTRSARRRPPSFPAARRSGVSNGSRNTDSIPGPSAVPTGICIPRWSPRGCASSFLTRSGCCARGWNWETACTRAESIGGTNSSRNTWRCRYGTTCRDDGFRR
jgi:phenylacetyl-CoA:acceptor oxidoreductase